METRKILCWFDGACEPSNPGGAMGTGSRIQINDKDVLRLSLFFPVSPQNSNNVAEYIAFEKVIDYLLDALIVDEHIHIYGDSKLVIMQMKGIWKIKHGLYVPYAVRCLEKLKHFKQGMIFLKWIPREQNGPADELSKAELIIHNVEFRIQPKEYI